MVMTDSQVHIWGAGWTRLASSDPHAATMFAEGLARLKGGDLDLEGAMGRGLSARFDSPQGS